MPKKDDCNFLFKIPKDTIRRRFVVIPSNIFLKYFIN